MPDSPDHPDKLDRQRIAEYEAEMRGRRRRARRLLKYLPRRSNVARFPGLQRFAAQVRKLPHLWQYRGAPLTRAFYVGSVLSLLPLMGIQLVLCAIAAIVVRANLPIMVALAFITNPLTSAPIYYGTYRIGRWFMDAAGLDGLGTAASMVPALTIGGITAGITLGAVLHLGAIIWSQRHATRRDEVARIRVQLRARTQRPLSREGSRG